MYLCSHINFLCTFIFELPLQIAPSLLNRFPSLIFSLPAAAAAVALPFPRGTMPLFVCLSESPAISDATC